MQGLQQFLAFAETVKQGSFAQAARELGAAPSTVAKAVARLEEGLGVKLFHRTTRQVSLTPDGERLFQRCQRILAEVEDLQAEAAGARGQPVGVLRIAMPIVFGRRVILPLLAVLAGQHPGLGIDARLSDQFADLVKEGIDVAIRVGDLDDSSLVARRIAWQSQALVASPSYLAGQGLPTTLAELARHQALVFRQPTSGRARPWQFAGAEGPVTLHPPTRLCLNDGEALVEAARLGLGLVQVPDYLASDLLASGELVEVLPSLRPPPSPISAVYPSGRLVPPRVRVFLAALQGADWQAAGG